jgi:hypothetical protein
MMFDLFPYGSRIYGTSDEQSDTDLIMVVDQGVDPEVQHQFSNVDLTVWTTAEYKRLLDAHEPSALECQFLPSGIGIRSHWFDFKLDLGKLRKAFSAKSSNSWVKAKKKIEVHGEFRLGLKSLFHSLRLLDFGIQIATLGRISDYGSANEYWRDIQNQKWGLAGFRNFTSWCDYKEYWQPKYNKLRTDFRLAAPLPEGENE